MTAGVSLVWVAGWGLGAQVFNRVISHLPEFVHDTVHLWNKDRAPLPPKNGLRIGIGHSIGGWWLAGQEAALDGLIYLGGFQRFSGTVRTLAPMQAAFQVEPETVLRNFYANSGAADVPFRENEHEYSLLSSALQSLAIDTVHSPKNIPIKAVHGAGDNIVPLYHAQREFGAAVRPIPGAGHIPQWTHPEEVAVLVRETVRQWTP
jgi:pimeloyl-ACP methyl ester carboxylesterase